MPIVPAAHKSRIYHNLSRFYDRIFTRFFMPLWVLFLGTVCPYSVGSELSAISASDSVADQRPAGPWWSSSSGEVQRP